MPEMAPSASTTGTAPIRCSSKVSMTSRRSASSSTLMTSPLISAPTSPLRRSSAPSPNERITDPRSRSLNIPTSSPSSTTGRCRTSSDHMSSIASSMDSFAEIVRGFFVISSAARFRQVTRTGSARARALPRDPEDCHAGAPLRSARAGAPAAGQEPRGERRRAARRAVPGDRADARSLCGRRGLFGRHADAMLGETEFFVRKAIGWVSRRRLGTRGRSSCSRAENAPPVRRRALGAGARWPLLVFEVSPARGVRSTRLPRPPRPARARSGSLVSSTFVRWRPRAAASRG